MKVRLSAIALLLALAAGLVALPLGAAAAPQRATAQKAVANPLMSIHVTGTVRPVASGSHANSPTNGSTSPFSGTLTLTHFATQNGKLVGTATLVSTLTTASGKQETVASQVVVPLQVTGTCSILHLDLGPITLNLLGLQITTNHIVIDITAIPGPGNLLGNLLCAIAHLLDPTGTGALAGLLNKLSHLLAAHTTITHGLAGIPVQGRTATGAAVSGSLAIDHVVNQGGHLFALGTVSTTMGSAAVKLPLQVTGTCPILHLDIAPINLNLLGLQITTSEIVLDITAIPGPGNLLGNLLCAVAGLLNNPNNLAALLNQILLALLGL